MVAGTKALAEYNNGGIHFTPSEISFSDYLDYWLENYSKSSCRYNTQNIHKRIVENHLKPSLGMHRLKSLTPAIIQEYVNKKFASGLKKNTLDGILSTLRASLKYAVVPAQMLQSSPAEYITYPKLSFERTESNRVIISSEDFEKMMQKFPKGNPFRYALLIGFYGGLRIEEIMSTRAI